MRFTSLIVAAIISSVLVGCSSTEPTPSTAENAPATTVAMAKCAGCGKEVPSASLVSHDGQMLCKDCIAAHGH